MDSNSRSRGSNTFLPQVPIHTQQSKMPFPSNWIETGLRKTGWHPTAHFLLADQTGTNLSAVLGRVSSRWGSSLLTVQVLGPSFCNSWCQPSLKWVFSLLKTYWIYGWSELVLKVRIQDSRENDFIEIELHRQELSYQSLLQVSCSELGVPPEQVEKMRKLPNTVLRKDKDIQRLQDFQERELLLVKSGNPEWTQHTSPRTETPCYNSNAAKMTY